MKYRDPNQLHIDWTIRLTEKANPFIFNKHELCINPEVVEVYKSGRDNATIELAQAPHGKWCYGYQFDCFNGGSSCGASYNSTRDKFPGRQDALTAALDQAKRWSEKYKDLPTGREAKAYEKFYKAIDKFRGSLTQLT